ncbi:uncharacterized protein LOC130736472 [Lotus japonicus]|uniref:uncharacterized protein LOC130736472 n=1 Tax=Lotus japonicus TaxID=34305 RepID=UPI00258A1456|nr:uncharacterized protein LOC130736472 [Lotus japonicus]
MDNSKEGWKHPVNIPKEGSSVGELKPEDEWNKEEDEEALGNSKALNAIFNGVDKNMFRLINTCTVAKDAWEILKTAHEGTSRVRMSRLQILTTQFENLKMKEDETISDFHMRLRDMANSFFALGEQIPEKRNKSIALVSSTDLDEDMSDNETGESISEAIALLGRKFNKVLKRLDKRSRPNVQDKRLDNFKNQQFQRRVKDEDKIGNGRGVQCHECEGFGHIRTECATYLKKQKKGMVTTWSDDESDTEGEDVTANRVTSFMVRCDSDDGDSDKEISDEELAEAYKLLYTKWKEACIYGQQQKKQVFELQAEKKKLTEEVALLNSKMEGMTKSIRMMSKSTDILDEILDVGKNAGDKTGIGFDFRAVNKASQNMTKEHVQIGRQSNVKMWNRRPQQSVTHSYAQVRNYQNSTWRCHFCGRFGHIRPYCFKLYGYPILQDVSREYEKKSPGKSMWKPKVNATALIAHTSLRASSKEDWYFDSGCSRHMTGVKSYLEKMKPHAKSFVTFGDGAKGKIRGIGKLSDTGSPNLDDVLLVEGLTANLISISQLCDQGLKVVFKQSGCVVKNKNKDVLMRGARSKDNCYMWTSETTSLSARCLMSKEDEVRIWHQKLGHLNLKSMKRIVAEEAVKGIPKLKIQEGKVCGECQIGKQVKMSHQKLQHLTTSKVLELLHMDLMGPMQVESLGGKRYVFVCVDDFSRFTWVEFLKEKSDTFEVFKELCLQVQREKGSGIVKIRSDHGKEFENGQFSEFCSSEGIKHEFSAPITPQQNGVVERKNRTLQESARAMLHAKNLPYHFWAEAINTACYIHNRVTIRQGDTVTQYELWKGKKPTVKYFHVFGSKCYILSDREHRRKLDPKSEVGIFLGYSGNSRAYRVYNIRTKVMMESINVVVDDTANERTGQAHDEDDLPYECTNVEPDEPAIQFPNEQENTVSQLPVATKEPSIRIQKIHPKENIIGDLNDGVITRSRDLVSNACFISKIEPKNVKEALTDEFWIQSMQEELGQFKRNEVWELPKGFVDPSFPDHVYRLKKALYGLKQAPRAWYERLTEFLTNNGYDKSGIDKTLFVKKNGSELMIAQIYVDDIVFGGMSNQMVEQFVEQMKSEFEMSLVGELTYFLGLQVKQMEDTLFITQSKYAKGIVKKFGLENAGHKRTPAATHIKLTKDEKGTDVDPSLYRSMIGSLLYLTASRPDITFAVGVCARYQAEPKTSHLIQVKRIIKYISGTSDYGILYSHNTNSVLTDVMTLFCDNLSAINISKNPIQHSRTKHIDIRHHFIRELVEDGTVTLEHVSTEKQLADIFTKALDATQFEKLRQLLGICLFEEL